MSERQWRKKFRTCHVGHFFGNILFLLFSGCSAKTLVTTFKFDEQKCRERRMTFPGNAEKKKKKIKLDISASGGSDRRKIGNFVRVKHVASRHSSIRPVNLHTYIFSRFLPICKRIYQRQRFDRFLIIPDIYTRNI